MNAGVYDLLLILLEAECLSQTQNLPIQIAQLVYLVRLLWGLLTPPFKAENTDEPLGMGSGDPNPSPLACLASVLQVSYFTSPAH